MALHDDLESTKRIWKTLSFPVKVFLGIGLLTNLMSGFSLLNQVVALSGFALEGHQFYYALTEPIRTVAEKLIVIPRISFDVLVIYIIAQGSISRALYLSGERKFYIFLLFSSPFIALWVIAAGMSKILDYEWLFYTQVIILSTIAGHSIIAPLSIGWLPKTNRDNVEFLPMRLATGYVFGVAMLVGAIGAISAGLHKGFNIG